MLLETRSRRWVLALPCVVALFSRDVLSQGPAVSSPSPAAAAPAVAPTDRLPVFDAAAHAVASSHVLGRGGAVGIAILDVDSGRMLAAVNEHLALNPASNAKLYTAGAALATLHGEHRYETTLTGKLEGDAVAGPLAIRGYGDPSLTTADLGSMVEELKGFGVRRIDGDVIVDQRFFDEQTTPTAFE
ncbi:MAG: D-alanyl-D-alanine carboxypeptidase, partial [Myxococcota bacterium]|nr:D-alanyl-D-alanine carboxypeptidase [Myxococcota bacterium]